ncbi:MAG TPA: preprotein translocase subunit SecE [Pyrinomonadaceae bacterium]|nr:preprotein translocase subunit SecE [Pyrinomonadaceae bacterium]
MSEAVDTLDNKSKGEKESVGEFIQHTREEIDKTSFPSSDDVKNTTIIVIVNVIFFAIFLFLIDRMWVYIIEALTWLVNKIVGI